MLEMIQFIFLFASLQVKCTGSCKACCKPVTAATRPVPTPPPTMPDFVSQSRRAAACGRAELLAKKKAH